MPACKVCGRWFAKIRDDEELCDKCEVALSRLSGYAVPVVRCKDCKYYDRGECYHPRHERHLQSICQEDDDFCSYGERKEEM
jgi:hypothetical protein